MSTASQVFVGSCLMNHTNPKGRSTRSFYSLSFPLSLSLSFPLLHLCCSLFLSCHTCMHTHAYLCTHTHTHIPSSLSWDRSGSTQKHYWATKHSTAQHIRSLLGLWHHCSPFPLGLHHPFPPSPLQSPSWVLPAHCLYPQPPGPHISTQTSRGFPCLERHHDAILPLGHCLLFMWLPLSRILFLYQENWRGQLIDIESPIVPSSFNHFSLWSSKSH